MAKPAEPVTWATDATQTAGTQIGQDTKLKPSAGDIAQGNQSGRSAPAKWYNWMFNLLGQWTQYLDNLPAESAFLGAAFNWTGVHNFRNTTLRVDSAAGEITYGDGAGAAGARTRTLRISALSARPHNFAAYPPTVPGSAYVTINEDKGASGPFYSFDLSHLIPTLGTITSLRVLVKPGAARTAQTTNPGDNGRMFFRLFSYAPNFTTPTSPGSPSFTEYAEDDGTTNEQRMDSGAISFALNRATTTLQVHVWGGDTATSFPDRVRALEIVYTDLYARGP